MSDPNTLEDQSSLTQSEEKALQILPANSSDQELSADSTSAASATSDEDATKTLIKNFIESGIETKIFIIKLTKRIPLEDSELVLNNFFQILKEVPDDKIEATIKRLQKETDKDFCAIKDYLISRLDFWKKLALGMEDSPLWIAFYVALFVVGATVNANFM